MSFRRTDRFQRRARREANKILNGFHNSLKWEYPILICMDHPDDYNLAMWIESELNILQFGTATPPYLRFCVDVIYNCGSIRYSVSLRDRSGYKVLFSGRVK